MEFQIGELSEEHKKYKTQQKHTHRLHARKHTKPKRLPKLHKLFKKAHMSHKYLFALKGVLIFC